MLTTQVLLAEQDFAAPPDYRKPMRSLELIHQQHVSVDFDDARAFAAGLCLAIHKDLFPVRS